MEPPAGKLLLAIESSCDETAAAVINRNRQVLSNVVATQHELHERFGGVVPEIASRAHLERILPVIDEALRQANAALSDLGAIAVATHPGLVGSLLVGLTSAKTLALVLGIPLISINHIEAHIYACRMAAGRDLFPAVGFVVSGGHSNLYDKVAQILGLDYPGGPQIEVVARNGDPQAVKFPRAFLHDARLDFSFSGLKTAVLYAAKGTPGARAQPLPLTPQRVADLAASFQAAVVDSLIGKCDQALKQTGRRTLLVGGGVAANTLFRQQLGELASRRKIELVIAEREFCTDNAAMGALGWELWERGMLAPLDLDVKPGLVRKSSSERVASSN